MPPGYHARLGPEGQHPAHRHQEPSSALRQMFPTRASAARSRDPPPGSEPGADGNRYPRRAPDESAGVHRAGNLRADAAAHPGLHTALPRRDAGGPQRNAHPGPGRRPARGHHACRPSPAAGNGRRPCRRGTPARPLVALLPVTHPRATQINPELTDLRDEPFIGCPSSPPSSIRQAVISTCRQAGSTPRIRQEAGEPSQPRCPDRCRARGGAGTGFGQTSAH